MSLAPNTGEQKKAPARTRQKSTVPDSAALLAWYDRHRRKLPWRAPAGERPEPYRVWLSEIMLQQTTVKTVAPYYVRFLARWPTVAALAGAALDDVLRVWAGLGYYARARNLHACAGAVMERHGGAFPASQAALRKLPGVGDYTAAAIAAIAFDLAAVPVDGNVERVVARLYAIESELPAGKTEIRRLAAGLAPPTRNGDFAQALMDLGATVCTPKNPACVLCPWHTVCKACRRGEQLSFPRKADKRPGPLRRGAAFVVRRTDGALLVRTRPPNGLLGRMMEVPTTAWTQDFDEAGALAEAPPLATKWRRVAGTVTHTFTHFPLELSVYTAKVGNGARLPVGLRWVAAAEIGQEALPNVMRKVIAHADRIAVNIGAKSGRGP